MSAQSSEPQAELIAAYKRWKQNFALDADDLTQFSPPLLLEISPHYSLSAPNVLVFGQETKGWSWTSGLTKEFPHYKHEYEFNDLNSLSDFLRNDDAVDALCWGYKEFDFASKQPENARSPFWRAFREIRKWGFRNVMWTNLCKFDHRGASILQVGRETLRKIAINQSSLVKAEIDALKPSCAIFFTGPYYDELLEWTFPNVSKLPIEEKIEQLSHADLPVKTFKTYHPNHLQISGNWKVLENLKRLATLETILTPL